MENPYPISVDNTLKRNQNVDNYSMRNFRDINVQFLNLFLIAEMQKNILTNYDICAYWKNAEITLHANS